MNELTRLLRAEGDGGGAGDVPPPDKTTEPAKGGDVYTKEQMENYFNSNMAAARRKWDKEKADIEKNLFTKLGISGPDEIDRLNQLREEAERIEQQKALEKGNFEKALADKEKKFQDIEAGYKSKIADISTRYEDNIKKVNLTDIALKAGADPMNIDMIVAFTKGNIKVIDDNTLQVVDASGNPLFDTDKGKEMALDDFMKSFLNSRPSLLKPSGTPGAGTSGIQGKHGRMTIDELKHIAANDPKRYTQLKEDGTAQAVYDAAINKQ